jgi:DNA-binding MarR family transcriptional regulator
MLERPLADRGLSYVQYVVLLCLRDRDVVNLKEIHIVVPHNSGALTRVIDSLADRGLLNRFRRDRDRRKVQLQLTGAGRQTIEELVPLMVEARNLALRDFSRQEMENFVLLLRKLNTRLELSRRRIGATKVAHYE